MENAQAHAKRLILVNGPMGVGKTAVCRQLVRLCAPAAFLDGDWCWMLEPFTVTAETKELVLSNIAHMLESYGRCTACRTVVFCWVMQTPDIVQQVLGRLPAGLFSPRLIGRPCAKGCGCPPARRRRFGPRIVLPRKVCLGALHGGHHAPFTRRGGRRRAGGAAIGKKAARPRPWAC